MKSPFKIINKISAIAQMMIVLGMFAQVVLLTPKAFGLDLKTQRHPICGVELYRAESSRACGEIWALRDSPACPLIRYNSGVSAEICGWNFFCREVCSAENSPGSCSFKEQECIPSTPKTCENPAFGSIYAQCRHPSHGLENFETCRRPEFGVDLYRECSFYKTPEEIDAYVDATASQLSINSLLLVTRQADLFSSDRQEAAFICLIEKYQSLQGYEDVVDDLVDKFFATFGFDYKASLATCSSSTATPDELVVRAGSFDCKDFDAEKIQSLTKPQDMSEAIFNRFKATCSAKIAYQTLENWFADRLSEVNLLLNDLVAMTDESRKAELSELKKDLELAE